MKRTRRLFALIFSIVAMGAITTACGGKQYLPPPEERPGEMEQYNTDSQETDERGRYSVDVPVQ